MSLPVFQMMQMVSGGDVIGINLISHTFTFIDVFAFASFVLQPDGSLTFVGDDVPAVNANEWHINNPSTTGGDFEVRANLTAGTTPTTNAGLLTWLRLDVARTWGNLRTTTGTATSTLTLDFRFFGQTTIIHTVTDMVVVAINP